MCFYFRNFGLKMVSRDEILTVLYQTKLLFATTGHTKMLLMRLQTGENFKAKATGTADHTCTGAKGEPCCCIQVRRWRHGCYTLVHDTDLEGERDFALDVLLYVGCEGWEPDQGGTTSYIASGEDEELLSVNPSDNSLALVYRGRDTLHFVKHLNTKCNQLPNREFYDISCTYYE